MSELAIKCVWGGGEGRLVKWAIGQVVEQETAGQASGCQISSMVRSGEQRTRCEVNCE